MTENGRMSRVLTRVRHGGHVLPDGADDAAKLAATREDISVRSAVTQRTAAVGTTAFDYLFRGLADGFPAHHLPQDDVDLVVAELNELGEAMVEQPVDDAGRVSLNSPIPPIYTYWGQFVDHDLTLATDNDTRISITDAALPPVPPDQVAAVLENLRDPALNLDSVYGDGPFAPQVAGEDAVPYDGIKLRLGRLTPVGAGALVPPVDDMDRDLPRADDRRALVGDGRNDENLVVAQLHVAFLRFHNAAVDWVRANEPERITDAEVFLRARDLTRWTYQWLVVHDYLRTVARPDVVDRVETDDVNLLDMAHRGTYMPVEFSVAAFRFGHSMVRATYDWNRNFGRPGNNGAPDATFVQLFQFTGGTPNAIGGFGIPTLPTNWPAEWDRMVDRDSLFPDRFARRIDTRIAPPLGEMFNAGEDPALSETVKGLLKHLARRNLLRGYRLAAPTGQAVATALGVEPLTRAELERGSSDRITGALERGGMVDRTPLWFYVLKEAEVREGGRTLGEVGSRIVAETLIGQVRQDPTSYVHRSGWGPAQGVRLRSGEPVRTIADFLRFAGVL
jgi:hypothetical protein